MSDGAGGLKDSAWLEFHGTKMARPRKRSVLCVEGAFRMAGPAYEERPAFDTGWVSNSITYKGVYSILGRFACSDATIETLLGGFDIDDLDVEAIEYPVTYFGVGVSDMHPYEFFADDVLGSEISYGPVVTTRPPMDTTILTGAPKGTGGASAKGNARKIIMSGPVLAQQLAASNTAVDICEIGIFGGLNASATDTGSMYAATSMPYITVIGAQAFTLFYSITLTQEVLA